MSDETRQIKIEQAIEAMIKHPKHRHMMVITMEGDDVHTTRMAFKGNPAMLIGMMSIAERDMLRRVEGGSTVQVLSMLLKPKTEDKPNDDT